MFQVSYPFMFGATTKFIRHGDFAPGICAPLVCVWPVCLPKYVMPSVHYIRHHTRVIQTSLAAIFLVYIINVASVWKVCYLLSAVQHFGTNIKWRWYRSPLTHSVSRSYYKGNYARTGFKWHNGQ